MRIKLHYPSLFNIYFKQMFGTLSRPVNLPAFLAWSVRNCETWLRKAYSGFQAEHWSCWVQKAFVSCFPNFSGFTMITRLEHSPHNLFGQFVIYYCTNIEYCWLLNSSEFYTCLALLYLSDLINSSIDSSSSSFYSSVGLTWSVGHPRAASFHFSFLISDSR
jgi:hypothetical protein